MYAAPWVYIFDTNIFRTQGDALENTGHNRMLDTSYRRR